MHEQHNLHLKEAQKLLSRLIINLNDWVATYDKEDIEVLGWKSSGNENELYSIKWIENPTDRKNAIWLKKFGENRLQIIDSRHEWHVSLFYGTIKNKSELKRLMKQLGIWE